MIVSIGVIQDMISSDGKINAEFRKQFGSGWADKFIFSPKPVPSDIAKLINEKIALVKTSKDDNFSRVLSEHRTLTY